MNKIVTTVEQTKHVKLMLLRASMKLGKHENFRISLNQLAWDNLELTLLKCENVETTKVVSGEKEFTLTKSLLECVFQALVNYVHVSRAFKNYYFLSGTIGRWILCFSTWRLSRHYYVYRRKIVPIIYLTLRFIPQILLRNKCLQRFIIQ